MQPSFKTNQTKVKMPNLYSIVKLGGLYRVITVSNERILFSSAQRINCKDFMRESLGYEPNKPGKQTE
jgi:hypothetical protein